MRPTVVTVLIAVGGVILFYLIRNIVLQRLDWNADNILPTLILALTGAVVFARVSFEKLPGVFRILTRTTAVGILVYLIIEPPEFTLADSTYSHIATTSLSGRKAGNLSSYGIETNV